MGSVYDHIFCLSFRTSVQLHILVSFSMLVQLIFYSSFICYNDHIYFTFVQFISSVYVEMCYGKAVVLYSSISRYVYL